TGIGWLQAGAAVAVDSGATATRPITTVPAARARPSRALFIGFLSVLAPHRRSPGCCPRNVARAPRSVHRPVALLGDRCAPDSTERREIGLQTYELVRQRRARTSPGRWQ